MITKESLTNFAYSLGLELLGSIRIEPVTDTYLKEWIQSGKSADMEWMSRSAEKREDPARVLEGAKSMLIVTLNYFQGDPPEDIANDPSRGRIARYAWYPEYHEVLKETLERLVQFIQTATGVAFGYRTYVDTGPVLERYWAERAGLGFIGKNSSLIFWKYGSYVFLGEILLDIELPEIHQHSIGGCGTCTRCLATCPTGAIVSPKVVDARMCISYLTIENRGVIPEKFRKAIGNRIFGCDICQEICPWNSKAKKVEGLPMPDWNLWAPRLTEAIGLSEDEFKKRYDNSPVLRTKYNGFIRNVAVALGNWGSGEAREALQKAKEQHNDTIIQEHIDWAIKECTI